MRMVLSTIIVEFPAATHNLEVKIEKRDTITIRGKIAAKIIGNLMPRRKK
jgi:hypothetical protein